MTLEAEIIAPESTPAPASRLPETAVIDDVTRPPDWRYKAARLYISDRRAGRTPEIPNDPLIMLAIRAMAGMNNKRMSGRFVLEMWSDIAAALLLGTSGRHSAITSELDVCLIKGWSYKEARRAGCVVNKNVYTMYAGLFMDVAEGCKSPAWFQDNLIDGERYNSSPTLLRSHLLAYYGDGRSGMGAALTGYVNKDETKLLKEAAGDERERAIADYSLRGVRMPLELYVPAMEAATKAASDHSFQEHMKDRDDAGDLSMEELAAGLESGIRAFSQSEIVGYDKSGGDSADGYIRKITEHDNGKENIGG